MDPLERSEPALLSDEDLGRLLSDYERRRPGAPALSAGVRPRRKPWTYRDIDALERLRDEVRRRARPR